MKESSSISNRLKRIEGQVKGLQNMLNDKRPCNEILTQLAAIRSALDKVGIHLISERMKECLETEEKDCEEAIKSAIEVFLKYARYIK